MEITYSCGQTIQLKQFEPINVHYSIKSETLSTDYNKEYMRLEKIVDAQVSRKITELEEIKADKTVTVKKTWQPHPKPFPDGEVKIEELKEPF
jgi:hypothetical protein